MSKTLLVALSMALLSGLVSARDAGDPNHNTLSGSVTGSSEESSTLSAPATGSSMATMGSDTQNAPSDVWVIKEKRDHDYPRH